MSAHEAEVSFRKGLTLLLAGETGEAEALFRSALVADSTHPGALHCLGLAAFRTGRKALALNLIRRSVRRNPAHAGFRFSLGCVLYDLNHIHGAAAALKAATLLDEADERAHLCLGIACLRIGRFVEAVAAFEKTVSLNPFSAVAYRCLAASLGRLGRKAAARKAQARAHHLSSDYESLIRLGLIRFRAGANGEALAAFRRAARVQSQSSLPLLYLGRTWTAAGRLDKALEAYRKALRVDPGNATIKYFIAAIVGAAVPPAPPRGYVRRLFDTFSSDFDRHLVQKLHYRVPEKLFGMVRRFWARKRAPFESFGRRYPSPVRRAVSRRHLRVLDAGCGTGLAAPLLRRIATYLAGVDLSPRMIDKARALGFYDELIVGELVEKMRSLPRSFDLIFAADVFCYLGDLGKVFRAASKALKRDGLLGFSVEKCEGERFVLAPSGRYAHPRGYISPLARGAGLVERRFRSIIIRNEGGSAVPGYLFLFQKNRVGRSPTAV